MLIINMLVFLFYLKFEKCAASLNELEEKITMAFIEKHDIRNWVLVEDSPQNLNDLNKLKDLRKFKISFTYVPLAKVVEYFMRESSFYIRTLIVFNLSNGGLMTSIINYLVLNRKYDFFYTFEWIYFSGRELSTGEEQWLLIPYDCLFLIVYPKDVNVYLLKEIYQVKGKVFSFEYGRWSNDEGLIVNQASMYARRLDFNGTELILQNEGIDHCNYRLVARDCVNLQILIDYSRILNLRISWLPISAVEQGVLGDVFQVAVAYDYNSKNDFLDLLSPFFKVYLNWYIKKPSFFKHANYYIRPFEPKLWISIFICLLIGVAFGVLLFRCKKSQQRKLILVDFLFLTFENTCNQAGWKGLTSYSYRIASFTFRFSSLFIIPSYCGTLLSYLAVRAFPIPFDSLKGLVENGKYMLGATRRSFAARYFEGGKGPLIKEIYENYFIALENYTKESLEEQLCNELMALAVFDNDINELTPPCEIYRIRNPITQIFSTVVVLKNNPFTKVFNYIHIRYYTSGIHKKLDKLLRREGITIPDIESFYNDVSINQMSQVLSIVPIGIIIAIIVILFETIWAFFERRSQNTRGSIQKSEAENRRRFRNKIGFHYANNSLLFVQNIRSYYNDYTFFSNQK